MSSSTGRLIDEMPTVSPRPVEMQVLAFGMSRTGTMSMQTALHQLGYKSYHAVEVGHTDTFRYWLEALRAKYLRDGRPYERADYDKLRGNYSAVTDIPCIMFVDELLAAYPNAKVILTERDPESWLVSMQNTFYVFLSWKSFHYLALIASKSIDEYWKGLNLIMSIWTGGDIQNRHKLRQSYLEHYAHIRRVVPKDKILDFNFKDDGFQKLCKFLNKPLPTTEHFPNINQPDNFIKMHKTLWWYLLVMVLLRFATYLAPFGVGAGAVWYYWYRQ